MTTSGLRTISPRAIAVSLATAAVWASTVMSAAAAEGEGNGGSISLLRLIFSGGWAMIPLIIVPPRSKGTRSGSSWFRAFSTRCLPVIAAPIS